MIYPINPRHERGCEWCLDCLISKTLSESKMTNSDCAVFSVILLCFFLDLFFYTLRLQSFGLVTKTGVKNTQTEDSCVDQILESYFSINHHLLLFTIKINHDYSRLFHSYYHNWILWQLQFRHHEYVASPPLMVNSFWMVTWRLCLGVISPTQTVTFGR